MNILWGKYLGYEGPWTRGVQPFVLGGSPTRDEETIAVITATEGGTYDAVNMYDVCLWTVGIIQWCNRAPQHSVDDLLGRALVADPSCADALLSLALERAYQFRKKAGGNYRFIRAGNPVDTPELQQTLYFLNASGAQGSWDDDSRAWAKRWVEASAKVWESPRARQAQLVYTAERVRRFASGVGRALLQEAPDTPIGRAWSAMYLSFAANNPMKAAAAVAESSKQTAGVMSPWTAPWLANMALTLTTHPGIAIYPARYNAIRPVIERIYGVDLPDYAKELSDWSVKNFQGRWYDVLELQRALLALGYDLGPEGATGSFDSRTLRALKALEVEEGVPLEHQDGCMDVHTAQALERALEEKGTAALT